MSRTAGPAALRALQCLPLLGALLVLRRLDTIVEAPPGGVLIVLPWRLDALTLVFVLALAAGIAAVPLQPRRIPVALMLACALVPTLLLEHLLALPAGLLLAALALASRRWLLSGLLLGGALAVVYLTAGAGWNDPPVAVAFGGAVAALLLASAATGLLSWSPGECDPLELALRPLWLLPLLRAIGLQPWRSELGLLTLGIGCAAALHSVAAAVHGQGDRRAIVVTSLLSMALAATGLLTTSGIAAALYGLLAYPLALGLLRSPRLAAPFPLTATFVAAWLAIGAVASSGAWLAGAALLLAVLGAASAALLSDAAPRPVSWSEALVLAASLSLGVCAAPVVELLIVPAAGLVQGGLTPFGLIKAWPWVGLAVLDSGQRRVTTLPALAVLLFALAPAAGVWVVARVLARHSVGRAAPEGVEPRALRRVWWLWSRGGG